MEMVMLGNYLYYNGTYRVITSTGHNLIKSFLTKAFAYKFTKCIKLKERNCISWQKM